MTRSRDPSVSEVPTAAESPAEAGEPTRTEQRVHALLNLASCGPDGRHADDRYADDRYADDYTEQVRRHLQADLGSAPGWLWRGDLAEFDPGSAARRAAREARQSGQPCTYADPAQPPEQRHGLVIPLVDDTPACDLWVFTRARAFSERDLCIARLAATFLKNALGHQRALQALRESRAQLRQSERMKSIGQLAGGVAHDFNNMLMVVSAAAEVMCASHVRLVIDTSHRAAELTQKLLAFARKGRSAMTVVDVYELLGAVRGFLSHALDRRISLRLSAVPGEHRVEANLMELQNAVLNVCLNARDAMPDGGRLQISAQRVEVDPRACRSGALCEPGSYVRIDVRDTGVGMACSPLAASGPRDWRDAETLTASRFGTAGCRERKRQTNTPNPECGTAAGGVRNRSAAGSAAWWRAPAGPRYRRAGRCAAARTN